MTIHILSSPFRPLINFFTRLAPFFTSFLQPTFFDGLSATAANITRSICNIFARKSSEKKEGTEKMDQQMRLGNEKTEKLP
jgi:hypothetical protein